MVPTGAFEEAVQTGRATGRRGICRHQYRTLPDSGRRCLVYDTGSMAGVAVVASRWKKWFVGPWSEPRSSACWMAAVT